MSIYESTDDELHAMAVSYLREEGGKQYAENSNASGGIIVRVKPERWLSVDYGKT